jgi:hypothetical protein
MVLKIPPRRWVAERTLAWITRHWRTVRDYQRLPAHHETYLYWAMTMTRRLARRRPGGSASRRLAATAVRADPESHA